MKRGTAGETHVPRGHRARLREAGRALADLARAPRSSESTFELGEVLGGLRATRLLARVRKSDEGAELLADRLLVNTSSCDLRDLLRLPYGTFGHEFAQWMIDHDLQRHLSHAAGAPTDVDQRYLSQRLLEIHDFWHVLSGYNCDPAGELGLLAFTLGQIRQRDIASLLLAAVVTDLRTSWRDRRRPWSPLIPYLWRAYWHGRRARFLLPVAVEDYFSLPIGSVRQRLGIEPLHAALRCDALPPVAVLA